MGETHLDVSDYAALVGKDLPQPEQFNYDVTRDGIRHFAYCIPDPNALYLDHEYAATTRWRGSPRYEGPRDGIARVATQK